MDKLTKTSLNFYLSEYLADLKRAGVKDLAFDSQIAPPDDSAPSPAKPVASRATSYRAVPQSSQTAQALPPRSTAAERAARAETPTRREVPRAPNLAPTLAPPLANDDPELVERVNQLKTIASEVAQCQLCAELVANRTQTVFGSGDPRARLLFLGEGPGAEEDLRGEPFVGRSGKLLTDMIEKGMGIPRSSVFICNVVRCRPPGNRNPTDDEAEACRPFLDATFNVVKPQFVCCLGSIAATNLLGVKTSLGSLRGVVHDYRGAKVVCTYHPAYLLRNPGAKKDAWLDLQLLMREMGLETPRK